MPGQSAAPAGMRVTAISLRRRPDRWAACEAHMGGALPAGIAFDVFEGTDAKAAAAGATGEAAVRAIEAACGCSVYRGWPVTEVGDVRRCWGSALDGATDVEAWVAYERACARAWRPDRARLYVDFFHRHLTLGDVGAALSHLRVAERAHAEALRLQLVFEDDSRPTAAALPALLAEVALLEAEGSTRRWPRTAFVAGTAHRPEADRSPPHPRPQSNGTSFTCTRPCTAAGRSKPCTRARGCGTRATARCVPRPRTLSGIALTLTPTLTLTLALTLTFTPILTLRCATPTRSRRAARRGSRAAASGSASSQSTTSCRRCTAVHRMP